MAKIPDASQLNSVAPRPSLTVVRENVGQQGDALAGFSQTVAALAEKENQRMTEVRAQDAYNKLRQQQMKLTMDPEEGYQMQRGENAATRPLVDDYSKKFQAGIDQITGTLSTPAQKARFKALSDNAMLDFKSDVMRHQINETDRYKAQQLVSTSKIEAENAYVNWFDPEKVQASRDRIIDTHGAAVKHDGVDADTAKLNLLDSLSNLHSGVLQQSVNSGNTSMAKEYFKKYSDEMTASDKDHMVKLIKQGDSDQKVLSAVDSGYVAMINSGKNGQLPDEKVMQDTIRKSLGKDATPDQIREASAEGQRRYGDILNSRKAAEENAVTAAQQWLIDNSGNFTAMPASIKKDLRDYAPDKYMAFATADVKSAQNSDGSTFMELESLPPDELVKTNLLPKMSSLTQAHFDYFVKKQVLAASGGKDQLTFDQQFMKTAQFNLFPNKKTLGPEEKAIVGSVQMAAREQIEAERKATGKMDTTRRQEIIDQHVLKYHENNITAEVNTDAFFDKDTKLKDIDYTQAKNVDWGGTNLVKIKAIPETSYQTIVDYAKRMNIEPTEDQISKVYMLSGMNVNQDQWKELANKILREK